MAEVNLAVWGTVIGWVVLIFGGGAAWGHHARQLSEHQKFLDKCDASKPMTEAKCKEFHKVRQETTDVKLDAIKDALDDIKKDRNRIDTRLGSLTSNLEVLMDRWDREIEHGS